MAKRYIVTGAAGHLGSTILRLLQGRNLEVRCLLRQGEEPVVESENIRYISGDICRPETLAPLFTDGEGPETVVIHTAGLISIAGRVSPLSMSVPSTPFQSFQRPRSSGRRNIFPRNW